MRYRKWLLVVVVALLGAQFVPLALPAQAVVTPPPAKRYSLTYDSEAGTLTAPGSTATGSGLFAGNVALATEGPNGSDYLVVGEDLGGGRVVRELGGAQLVPFGADWKGGVSLAAGDVGGSIVDELVAGQATGGSLIRVYPLNASGSPEPSASFQAYEDGFTGGTRVAVGDVDGNGSNEIVVAPGPGRAPTVKVFSAAGTLISSANVYADTFTGGVFVAAANLDGDAASEIVVGAGAGGGPHVKVLNGLEASGPAFFAFDPSESNGVRVAAGTLDGQQVIAATIRTATGSVVRLFKADGSSAAAERPVPASDGALSLAIRDGDFYMYDAAPRVAGVNPEQFFRHTRAAVRLYGAGLVDTIEDITAGTEEHPLVVTAIEPDPGDITGKQDLLVTFAIPADTPTGATPMTLTVRTPGGTATHELRTSINVGGPEALPFITTGVGSGGGPHVRVFGDDLEPGFMGGDASRSSGVRVARADLDVDAFDEFILSYGPGLPPVVRVADPDGGVIGEFLAYAQGFRGGVFVASGDVDPTSDGGEIITGADAGGGPHVKIFNAAGQEIGGFMAYGQVFTGGVRVGVADVDGDGVGEIITAPGPGGGPHVRVWTAAGQELGGFMAYGAVFTGGVFVAGADVDGDSLDEVVTGPGAGGGPHVRVFTETGQELAGFMAYGANFTGGVSVAGVGDDLLGPNLIATGPGPGGGPHVRLFAGDGEEVLGYMAYDAKFTGGVFVAGGMA